MARSYYIRLNMIYLIPQNSHSFTLYSESKSFSHNGSDDWLGVWVESTIRLRFFESRNILIVFFAFK